MRISNFSLDGGGGGTRSDLCNFSAKSTNPQFLKVKSEFAKGSAENDKKEIFNKIIHIKVYKVIKSYARLLTRISTLECSNL